MLTVIQNFAFGYILGTALGGFIVGAVTGKLPVESMLINLFAALAVFFITTGLMR